MEIRHMEQNDDKYAISRIYEESWKSAYAGIIPQSYLESISGDNWIDKLDNAERNTLIMIEDGKMIGTSSYGRSRFADYEDYGEIISIYFLPQYMGKGYGKKLLEAVMRELFILGYADIFLWVLEENQRARRFYEKAGFVFSGNYLDTNIGGKELREMQYCYHSNIIVNAGE
ncbi:MAG: GNAT family N-acetyltransferase [Lachnospiraceae bacterium]|nr:GNAT family N-acetyltransferase [Lachnospiraceae bacterium]